MSLEIRLFSLECLASASGPLSFAPHDDEAVRLHKMGWNVGRYHNRFRITRSIGTIEEAAAALEENIFNSSTGSKLPAIVTVRFTDVKCASVEGSECVELGRVIMCDPTDPLKTELFPFGLDVQLIPNTEIDVTVSQRDTTRDPGMFLQLLRICEHKFDMLGDIQFNNRKAFKRAKRRYLLWRRRRGTLTPETESLARQVYEQTKAGGGPIGKLRNAYKDWQTVLKIEEALRA